MNNRPLVPRWFAVMIAASAAVVTLGVFQPTAQEPTAPAAPAAHGEIGNCIWIDRIPQDAYDKFQMYIFDTENRVGISGKADSSFKITLEIFEFIDLGEKVQFYFPHDRRKPSSNYKVEPMKKPTDILDTQLTIDQDPQNGSKKMVFYTGPDLIFESNGEMLPPHMRQVLQQVRTQTGK